MSWYIKLRSWQSPKHSCSDPKIGCCQRKTDVWSIGGRADGVAPFGGGVSQQTRDSPDATPDHGPEAVRLQFHRRLFREITTLFCLHKKTSTCFDNNNPPSFGLALSLIRSSHKHGTIDYNDIGHQRQPQLFVGNVMDWKGWNMADKILDHFDQAIMLAAFHWKPPFTCWLLVTQINISAKSESDFDGLYRTGLDCKLIQPFKGFTIAIDLFLLLTIVM